MLPIKKIEGYVFDNTVHEALFKLSSNGIIDSIDEPIASGKEAITFLGHIDKTYLVAKIYKIETSNFKKLGKYIKGDYRFKKIKNERRNLFLIWASKEYKNLTLAINNGVSVPVPIAREKNILILSLVGTKEGNPHPKLIKFRKYDFEHVYSQIIENYAKLLYGAKIVHADFSPYNILIDPETQKITIIDMGQAVVHTHPKAKAFLKRDIINITDFLNKRAKNKITYEQFLEDLKHKKKELYKSEVNKNE
jgi:RIO kinase 1